MLICIGTNGETYFNTAALVSCVRNFSHYRGPVVGILKGFGGLSGAIFTAIYAALYAPDQASLIFMVAVGPTLVAILAMFVVRPVPFEGEENALQGRKFSFLYGVCLLLAVYLLSTIIVQDRATVNHTLNIIFACGLLLLLALPLILLFNPAFDKKASPSEHATSFQEEVNRLREPLIEEADLEVNSASLSSDSLTGGTSSESKEEGTYSIVNSEPSFREEALIFSELEDEKETLPEPLRRIRLQRASSRLFRAVAQGIKFRSNWLSCF